MKAIPIAAVALALRLPCAEVPAQLAASMTLSSISTVQGKRTKKPKIKPQVKYAKTWEEAVAEAKLLKVPLVIHSHGFN